MALRLNILNIMCKDSAETAAVFYLTLSFDVSFPENPREYPHKLYITQNRSLCWIFSQLTVRIYLSVLVYAQLSSKRTDLQLMIPAS